MHLAGYVVQRIDLRFNVLQCPLRFASLCCFGSCFEDQKWSSDAVYRSMTESTQKDSALASGGQDGRSSRPFSGLWQRCRGRCLHRHRRRGQGGRCLHRHSRGPVRGVNGATRGRGCATSIRGKDLAAGERVAASLMKARLRAIHSVKKLGANKVEQIRQQEVEQRAVGQ